MPEFYTALEVLLTHLLEYFQDLLNGCKKVLLKVYCE